MLQLLAIVDQLPVPSGAGADRRQRELQLAEFFQVTTCTPGIIYACSCLFERCMQFAQQMSRHAGVCIHAGSAPALHRHLPLERGLTSWNREQFDQVKLKAAVDNAQREQEFLAQV